MGLSLVEHTCSRCGKKLREAAIRKSVHCIKCNRWYHRTCFMADTGVVIEEKAPTSDRCVCCLAGTIDMKSKRYSHHMNKYAKGFIKNGFCVVPLAETKTELEQITQDLSTWNADLLRYFKALLTTYECQAEMGGAVPSLESGYSNFRQRCPGRFEIIADFITSKVVPLVANAQTVQQTLDALLCNSQLQTGKKVMSSGCFLSLMGSETQNAHTDGPALSNVVNLFPYAINVFVPLISVDSRNGTEFFPGSHVVGDRRQSKSVSPPVALGSVLLFDYRVVHRGLRNAKSEPRPCYYVTFSRSWYQDTYNFSERRYKKRLDVDPTLLESREERMAKKSRSDDGGSSASQLR
ncbi:Phytanoyl-CoA dioxygenase (PhyH) [Leishmania donovani]|uniref:Phytanoyl-CoA_dioxygenase_(PhyH)_-_putative n=4 Tax=Leishmania donovani species complex TaxID=38574 RepID=A0A6L0XKV1_LEIIN|nr:conserved hypothetical protein [Leishmania infantum JPCM5]CAC9507864.1 Phytanoyl-CoA_dioxygenase_(PhyH)_-_putative [Leishmania infantum]CAJ1990565.1 Phytanoyl-CoA dioxygenase (PhyH) [Leishmania donovani]CAM69654.1 conserved hypothetical protein [Leishmania infantum JPCM5]SUZ43594.1 Phytanoyl-CoA_dioxygenase_(PhyH)_-_putative [Leishmania infantum]VDZ46420.1 Phytanoyl-CoA_dioxygenase_(PhyH)_putative/Pfam:PF05721 [Leishmania donovani]|eukprot:XP_001466614.1 conserved hypothetical protein [Leishmania infantum JPCM5]